VGATYIDNQEILQYPIIQVVKQLKNFCNRVFVFASDIENEKYLQSQVQTEIVNINHKIRRPVDISIAQNRCVRWLKENTTADFIAYQQADLIITELGINFAKSWIDNPTDMAIGLAAAQNKLYVELLDNPYGCVLMKKEFDYVSIEDGWEVQTVKSPTSYRHDINPWENKTLKDNRLMMDLGYISVDAYYRKLINHVRIWPDVDWKIQLRKLYDTDKKAALRETFKRIKKYEESKGKLTVVEYSGQYKWLIDLMSLYEDYKFVESILLEDSNGTY
jgi:hypothetical protein